METESSFLQNDLLMNHAPSFSEKSESAKVKEDSPLPKKAKKESGIMAGIREAERDAIIEALTAAGGNVSKAARAMGLTRQTLVYRMKKHNID